MKFFSQIFSTLIILVVLVHMCHGYSFDFDEIKTKIFKFLDKIGQVFRPSSKLNNEKSYDISSKLVCHNEIDGQELDWFTAYKLPTLHHLETDNPYLVNGTAYTLMTNRQQSWRQSSISMNDTRSAPSLTFEPLYRTDFRDPNNKLGYILYNDQAHEITVLKGHTKGVLMFDDKRIVWVIHSIPHYPPKPSSSDNCYINPSQCVFGQSMVCVSMDIDQLDTIAQQLLYTYPQVYDYVIPKHLRDNVEMSRALDTLEQVIGGQHIQQAPWFSTNYLTTSGGEKLKHFAKFTLFGEDLYSGLVAEQLASDMNVETWNNGAGTLSSNCSATLPSVYNIEHVKIDSSITFSVHHDHSKWLATTGKPMNSYTGQSPALGRINVRIACIGDINRQLDQFKRAGGTLCFMNNMNIWQAYNSLVNDVEPCH